MVLIWEPNRLEQGLIETWTVFTAYLDCDKDPGETDGDAGDANNIAEVEINYSKENTEKDGERSKKPSQKIGRCLKNVCKQEFWAESTIRANISWIQINEIWKRFELNRINANRKNLTAIEQTWARRGST